MQLTLGGEPTYVPMNPEGAEWNYAAVGPTKLAYAWKVAENLLNSRMAGSRRILLSREVLSGRSQSAVGRAHPRQSRWHASFSAAKQSDALEQDAVRRFADGIREGLGLRRDIGFSSPIRLNPDSQVLAMPIDYRR